MEQFSPTIPDGNVSGAGFVSNGWSIRVDDYGVGSQWHGASMQKGLIRELEYWKTKFRIGLHGTKNEQLGRLMLIGKDINQNTLFSIEFRDGNVYPMSPYATWKIKDKIIMETYGGNIGTGKRGGGVLGYWKDFTDGYFDLAKRKNKDGKDVYACWIARYDQTTKATFRSLHHEWVDVNNEFTGGKLAYVQVHIGAYCFKSSSGKYLFTTFMD